MAKIPFDTGIVENGIDAVAALVGRETFFRGNCGAFSIALAKWIAETMDVAPTIVGVALVYPDDIKPLRLSALEGRDMNHVFVCVTVADSEYLFDGEGLVSEEALEGWHKQTWFDCGPGYDKEKWLNENDAMPSGVGLVFGDLSVQSIQAIESATAGSMGWKDMLNAFQKINSASCRSESLRPDMRM